MGRNDFDAGNIHYKGHWKGGGGAENRNFLGHKIENFFGSDFEFCSVLLLVMLKYCIKIFGKNFFD
jgi:hypothetical protein